MKTFQRFVAEAGQADHYSTWGFIDPGGQLVGPKQGETNHGDLARSIGYPQHGNASIYAAINGGYVRYLTIKGGEYSCFLYGCPKSIQAIIKYLENTVLGGRIYIESMDNGHTDEYRNEHEAILKLRARK